MATVDPQLKVWSRDEYDRAADAGLFSDQRVELIDGAILMMSPMKAGHAIALQLTENALRRVFGDKFCVRVQLPLLIVSLAMPDARIRVRDLLP